ncbi:MAG: hypothetical protein Q7J68_02950 [Thermoplasmata archaeon]|nr:hypothetical protein [Thermoplasmata archaeon]
MKLKNVMGNEYSSTIGKSVTVCTRYGKQYVRKWVKPKDPKTPLQMQQREKYARANEIWKEMSPDEKQIYREHAKGLGMSGYNLFVSEFTRERS